MAREVVAAQIAVPVQPPLVLLCAPRSFSSVTAAMLGQHPLYHAFPELNLFVADSLSQLLQLEAQSARPGIYLGGLTRALAALEFGAQSSEALARARHWVATHRHWSTATVMQFLMALVAPRALVDKSPRTALAWTSCERAVTTLPGARFLHLARHPAAAVRSLAAAVQAEGPPVHRAFAALWLGCQHNILRLKAVLPPEAYLLVQGEQVLREPEAAMQRVLQWLELPCLPAVVQAMMCPERSPYAFAWAATGGADNGAEFLADPVLRRLNQPAPGADALTALDLGRTLAREVADTAARLGYPAS